MQYIISNKYIVFFVFVTSFCVYINMQGGLCFANESINIFSTNQLSKCSGCRGDDICQVCDTPEGNQCYYPYYWLLEIAIKSMDRTHSLRTRRSLPIAKLEQVGKYSSILFVCVILHSTVSRHWLCWIDYTSNQKVTT